MYSGGFSGNSDELLYDEAKKNAVSLMETLFEKRALTADIHFVIEENGEKKRIPAHRSILAIGSPIFEEMFFGPEKLFRDGDIPTTKISSEIFGAFIPLFYGEESTSFKASK